FQRPFETFRRGDAADACHIGVAQFFKRQLFARVNILQITRAMRAFDDLGCAIESPNAGDEFFIGIAGAFRDEDVTGAAEISRRLSQRSARQQELVSKWRLSIYQDDVETVFEMEILQAVVEQKRV